MESCKIENEQILKVSAQCNETDVDINDDRCIVELKDLTALLVKTKQIEFGIDRDGIGYCRSNGMDLNGVSGVHLHWMANSHPEITIELIPL